MIPSPILRVLSTLSTSRVEYLLMGGQACILYGAAEFSRDIDIALAADAPSLARLTTALDELDGTPIAVPPPSVDALQHGHALHFRLRRPDVAGLRVDVMSAMRGVDTFDRLWGRRTSIVLGQDVSCEVMSLPDLVLAKRTQRDKDWPMARRLVEAHYAVHCAEATDTQVSFWLRMARTPAILLAVARSHRPAAEALCSERPLLCHALAGREDAVAEALEDEERLERALDRAYWRPLIAELAQMRRGTGR